jgi:ADP-heptose:LPS heptosyltransferase
VIDLASELRDFANKAAAAAELDLVIAVDTAVAHLAPAMGRPVWLLVPAIADWRWLVEGDESPWYPTLRLFRQERAGDWKSVVDAVCRSLERKIVAPRRHADA